MLHKNAAGVSQTVSVCPLVTELRARKWAFLSFRGAKLTEHEGDRKAPNCLLIAASSLANHYTSSSHLFSTFYSSSLTPPRLPSLWPRSLTSPRASPLLYCVKVTVCACVSVGEWVWLWEKKECVLVQQGFCSENYLACPLNVLSSHKKELCFPLFAVSSLPIRISAARRSCTSAVRRSSISEKGEAWIWRAVTSFYTGRRNVPLFWL